MIIGGMRHITLIYIYVLLPYLKSTAQHDILTLVNVYIYNMYSHFALSASNKITMYLMRI